MGHRTTRAKGKAFNWRVSLSWKSSVWRSTDRYLPAIWTHIQTHHSSLQLRTCAVTNANGMSVCSQLWFWLVFRSFWCTSHVSLRTHITSPDMLFIFFVDRRFQFSNSKSLPCKMHTLRTLYPSQNIIICSVDPRTLCCCGSFSLARGLVPFLTNKTVDVSRSLI